MRTQVEPLRAAEAGTAMLTIRLVSGRRHIQLFGFDYTFCSQHVTPQARRSRIAFNDERELERVCVACRWHMRQALA